MSNTIDITCHLITAPRAVVIFHRDGTATVRAPYIKWANNKGSLAFKRIKMTQKWNIECLHDLIDENNNHVMTYYELLNRYDMSQKIEASQ